MTLTLITGDIALRRTLPNTLGVIKKHLERLDPLRWFKQVRDRRKPTNRYWHFGYLMEVVFAGMLSGCKTLRAVETFSEIYEQRVPDTTLHDVLVGLDGEPLRAVLVREVKEALRAHELPKEAFPVRITAIDGKSVSVSRQKVGPWSDPIGGGGTGSYRHMALRALHVSNDTKLFLGQREIPSKSAETTEFRFFLDQLLADYGQTGLLEVISTDAGMVSKENADYIVDRGLHYIMALKGPQQVLFEAAHRWMQTGPRPVTVTTESGNGKEITRALYRLPLKGLYTWEHGREIWQVKQTTIELKTGKTTLEERFFLTSLPPRTLTNAHVLHAVRMHWGVENNGFWTLDCAWFEDDAPWTHHALLFVSLLRLLAYNAVSRLLTRRLRQAKARALSWSGILTLLEHACCQLRQHWLAEHKAAPVTSP